MTKLNIWIQGARPKTLGAAIAFMKTHLIF